MEAELCNCSPEEGSEECFSSGPRVCPSVQLVPAQGGVTTLRLTDRNKRLAEGHFGFYFYSSACPLQSSNDHQHSHPAHRFHRSALQSPCFLPSVYVDEFPPCLSVHPRFVDQYSCVLRWCYSGLFLLHISFDDSR